MRSTALHLYMILGVLSLAACANTPPKNPSQIEPAADGGETRAATDASSGGESAPSCDGTTCEPGQHCELVQVMCIRAPCPPLPTCVIDAI